MNIFVTDTDPRLCAEMLDDVRLNKMIVETAQMLSTAIWLKGIHADGLYKPSHMNHPCTKWAGRSYSNIVWLHSLGVWMLRERTSRGSRTSHATGPVIAACGRAIVTYYDVFHKLGLTPFQNSSLFKDEPDVCLAYRKTMCAKWATDTIRVTWVGRGEPAWRKDH